MLLAVFDSESDVVSPRFASCPWRSVRSRRHHRAQTIRFLGTGRIQYETDRAGNTVIVLPDRTFRYYRAIVVFFDEVFMPSDHSENPRETNSPTASGPRGDLNGRRLALQELNLGDSYTRGDRKSLWQRFMRALSQFLAGMYTGESCAGTPHGEHRSDTASRKRNGTKI